MVRAMSGFQPSSSPAPFDGLEDKSLASVAETKEDGAQDSEQTRLTVSVKMLHHAEYDGKQLVPGRSYDLPRSAADLLVGAKRAVRS